MADQSSRGGKKETKTGAVGNKKHSGVRPGSTGTKKERGQQEPRKKVVPDQGE